MKRTKLSVIVPVYNEKQNIRDAISQILIQFENLDVVPEIIVVDNCSTDGTGQLVEGIAKHNKNVKYIKFTRNFGPSVEASLLAGYRTSTGDAAIVIYSDLQDPPELIPTFVDAWRAGNDIVFGRQKKRVGEPLWRRISVRIFYRAMDKFSETPIDVDSGDFRLISRRVIDVIVDLPELARFNRGLISWTGFKSQHVDYERQPRIHGKSSANFGAILRTALNALTSFSLAPLKLLTYSGLFITLASFIGALFFAINAIFRDTIPGLSTLIILILFSLGLNMLSIGILGEYIGRIQQEIKSRPLYLIDKSINVE